MKTVLLPIDYFKNDPDPLKKALAYLQALGGHVNILLLKTYVVSSDNNETIIDTHDSMQKNAADELSQLLKRAQDLCTGADFSFETVLQMGSTANVITRFVKKKPVDCIILPTISTNPGTDEALSFLEKIACPVVMLPLKNS